MTAEYALILGPPLFWNAAMLVLFFYYRGDMLKSPGAKFVFGISDLWALMLGLSPLLILIAHLIEIENYGLLLVAIGVGVPHGLAGTYLATLYNSFMRHDTERSQWAAFFSTVAGAFLGTTLFAIVSLLLLFVIAFFAGLFVSTLPVSLVLVASIVFFCKISRRPPKTPPAETKPASIVAQDSHNRSRDA